MTEETLFHQALARVNPQERAAFLDQACAGEPELRVAVETLLAAHERSRDLRDNPASDLGTPVATAASDLGEAATQADLAATVLQTTSGAQAERAGEMVANKPGSADPAATAATNEFTPRPEAGFSLVPPAADHRLRLDAGAVIAGRYALQEKIGEGVMGEVWVAQQTEPVKRRVALKLIKPGMDSRAVLQRFEQERQALALMDHPNIARVYDAGMTATGQPFFVMELVNGRSLTNFCDELKLSPQERLELFLPICQAVQHAHQKGIVHRDLKPANILVTVIDGKPVPKVIDFGVAKATAIAGKLTEESLATQFGSVVGTLEYMSPEQAGFTGEDIDTRSDIYSLGVILYELLTGLRPIDASRLKKAALTEMIRIIREEEPSKARCSARWVDRRSRRPSTRSRWRSMRNWPRTTPTSPNSSATWRTAIPR
ncbi:MAG: serine/threonine-protein kinase [Isosphaeraceae bacterium]